ncbi:MAG: 4Fe-4S dicluster domain-containing protein [Bacteroidales bacterium]|nr:4Fe-4S dicluster domain-containing protein [Bacteroidales bacterium]
MNYTSLKKLRVIISIVFLVLITLVFIDYRNILPEEYTRGVLYLQFIPSLLKFINLLSVSVVGFIVVLILTFVFGRVYCSSICPLGVFMDIVSFFSRKIMKKKKRFRYKKPHNILRYFLLAVTVIFFTAGSIYFILLLDPYSNFGRIITYFVNPVIILVNNSVAGILENFNVYTIFPVEVQSVRFELWIYPMLFLILVTWMSFTDGRLFCNTICPVGTLLGLLSRFSWFKIRFDKENCTLCGRCTQVCKSDCLDFKEQIIDYSRCVECFNCLPVCTSDAIKYTYKKIGDHNAGDTKIKVNSLPDDYDKNKRKFLTLLLSVFAGSAIGSIKQDTQEEYKDSTVPEEKEFPVTPPGSLSIRNFTHNCTACALCVSACPSNVLQPSFNEYGFTGMMQPHMDYHTGYCNFECTRCSEVCPTGAILPVPEDEKTRIQTGIAKFVKENCIVHTEKTDCGACSEHCPTKAVKMIPYEGDLLIPEVTDNICVGCGACEFACPTTPFKAIYIDGHSIHEIAKEPEEEELEKPVGEEEFPF